MEFQSKNIALQRGSTTTAINNYSSGGSGLVSAPLNYLQLTQQTSNLITNGIIQLPTSIGGLLGSVTGETANYFINSNGWIFSNGTKNIASISNDGELTVKTVSISNGITRADLSINSNAELLVGGANVLVDGYIDVTELKLNNGVQKIDLSVGNDGALLLNCDLYVLGNIYSEKEVSAFGLGTGSGGNGSGLIQSVYSYNNLGSTFLDSDLTNTFNAYTINRINNRLVTIENTNFLTGLTGSLVINALGYTPYNATNPNGYITGINKAQVEAVLIGAITSHTHNYELPLTFSTGLSRVGNTITNTITQYTNAMADARVVAGITGKQNTITTGTTAQYFRGDLSLATMPTTLPASDVYSWAKQSTKPSYNWSEIGSKPTTLSSFTNDLGNYGSWITASALSPYQLSSTAINTSNIGAQSVNYSNSTRYIDSPDGDRNPNTKLPTTNSRTVRFDFTGAGYCGTGGNYAGVMTYTPWDGTSTSTGDASYQLAFGGTAVNGGGVPMLRIRKGIDSTWNSFYTIWHEGNLTPSNYQLASTAINTDNIGSQKVSGLINSGGSGIQSSTYGTSYSQAVCVREVNGYAGNSDGNVAPRLGFHWGGLVASSISIGTNGSFYLNNNPGTGRENLYLSNLYGSSLTMSGDIYGANYHSNNINATGNITSAIQIQAAQFKTGVGGIGMIGDYSEAGTSSKIIWTIGAGWTSLSNHYGIGYCYENITNFGHSIFFADNGNKNAQISLSTGSAKFNGTGYFGGSLTVNGNITASGNITNPSDNSYAAFGNDGNIGFTKKSGFSGKMTFAAGTSFVIAQSSASNLAASNTFVDKLTLDGSGNLTITGSFTSNGNIYANGEVTAYSSSDERLKQNIQPLIKSLNVINKLNPVSYNWNEKAKELNPNKTDKTDVGVIAQELKEVLPNLVHNIYNDEFLAVDYVKLIPYLIGAIQELTDKINKLENNK